MTKPFDDTKVKFEMEVDAMGKYDFSSKSDPELEQQLFEAAKQRYPEKIEEILQQGISPNITDVQGRTPLHWAMAVDCPCNTCIENAESCLVVLLNSPETNVNIQDKEGQTPVHLAAECQLDLCLRLMIYKFGANVYLRNKEGDQAIKLVAKKCPNVMSYILDRSIVIDRGDANSEKCVLKIDFRPVVGGDEPLYHQTVCGKVRKRPHNELQLLRSLLTSSKFARQKILAHPAIGIFLEQKWRRVRRTFIGSFILYMFWLLLYTGYILYVYLIKCPCRFYMENMKGARMFDETTESHHDVLMPQAEAPSGLTVEEAECLAASGYSYGFFALVALTVVMYIYEILKIIITPKLYFKSMLNILHWILILLVVVSFVPTFAQQNKLEPIQYQVASFTIFLAWALILSQIGKFPTVGKYMEIFGHVLRHFWSFLLTYISLFIAFALAFSILFPGDKPYTIFPFAFLKIFVMMVGEMEYQEMFYSEQREEASGPLVGHFLYATFVIVVAIVLMNLLVGLTVSDIQGLQKEAEFSRVSRQIVDMFHLESFMYSDKVPIFIKKACHKMTSVVLPLECEGSSPHGSKKAGHGHGQPLLTQKYWFSFFPNDTRDLSVSERYKTAAVDVAVKLQAEIKAKICEKRKCYIGKYKLNFNIKEKDGGDQQA